MNYEEMSDSKINCFVAMRMEGVDCDSNGNPLFAVDCFSETKGTHARVCFVGDGGEYTSFDPCNNPSDAWPIITKYGICTMVVDCRVVPYSWFASTHMRGASGRITVMHENPLRAAMICFLKMKDAQHD